MNFRPCIDLHQGQVKQIVGSTLTDDDRGLRTNFVAAQPPSFFASLYRRDGLTGGHVIMLGAGNEDAARDALSAWPGGLQVGGGVQADNARAWLDAGAAQVILTSYIFRDGVLVEDNLKRIVAAVGPEHLVLDLSCRKRDGRYYIVTDRWQKFTSMEVHTATLERLARSCCEFLIHAVDVEGKQSGIDAELLQLMASSSPLPCVYAGGISTFAEIDTIRRVGGGRVAYTIGSALDIFGGKALKYAEVVARERALR